MTKKQIEKLKIYAEVAMRADYMTDDKKIAELKAIYKFVEQARDLYLIDESTRAKIVSEIGGAATKAYDEYRKSIA